jgi:hypothetical protein
MCVWSHKGLTNRAKLGKNWPSGFQRCQKYGMKVYRQKTDDGHQVMAIAHQVRSGELKKYIEFMAINY